MTEVRSFTFTTEPMLPAPKLRWWRRVWLRLQHKPLPRPVQPPGTVPLVIDSVDGGRPTRIIFPAARFDQVDDQPTRGQHGPTADYGDG